MFSFFVSSPCIAQDWGNDIRAYLNEQDEEYSDSDFSDLEDLTHHKLNINDLNEEDCSRFFFLSDFEKQSLLYYIHHKGPLLSLYELQYVVGLPLEKASLLSYFCHAAKPTSKMPLDELIEKGRHSISSNTIIPIVSTDTYKEFNSYAGNAIKECIRYRFSSFNTLYWGITIKKDMGEALSLQDGFDFRSAYIQIKNRGIVENLIIGDFKISLGEGLIFSQEENYINSMGQVITHTMPILEKKSSSSEYAFSRGIGTSIKYNKFLITPFLSIRHLDGKYSNDSIFPFSINESGYHRTENECNKKEQIRHEVFGGNILLRNTRWRMGISYIHQHISIDSIDFTLHNMGIQYSYLKRNIKISGETALDKNYRIATCNTIQYILDDDCTIRNTIQGYSAGYQSFMSIAPKIQNDTKREINNITDINVSISSKLNLTIESSYSQKRPTIHTGSETSKKNSMKIKLKYSAYEGFCSYYQFGMTTKVDTQDTMSIDSRYSHKLYATVPIGENLLLKVCGQCSAQKGDTGYLIYEDILWRAKPNITFSFRNAQFDAPFTQRLYVWEDDVLYTFTNAQYYYAGTYWYCIVKWKWRKKISGQIKISHTRYSDKYDIPESYEVYRGNGKIKISIAAQVIL